jgi:tRNA(Ile)-lysidine synthase TilS/MesJ
MFCQTCNLNAGEERKQENEVHRPVKIFHPFFNCWKYTIEIILQERNEEGEAHTCNDRRYMSTEIRLENPK